jgi:hypothetical protein
VYCDTGDPGLLARHGFVVLGVGLQPLQLVQGVPPVQHPAKYRVLQICNKMRALTLQAKAIMPERLGEFFIFHLSYF